MLKYLLLIDRFGLPVELNLKGHSKHKTIFGSFCTLLLYCIMAYYCYTQLVNFKFTPSTIISSKQIVPSGHQYESVNLSDLALEIEILGDQSSKLRSSLDFKLSNDKTIIPLLIQESTEGIVVKPKFRGSTLIFGNTFSLKVSKQPSSTLNNKNLELKISYNTRNLNDQQRITYTSYISQNISKYIPLSIQETRFTSDDFIQDDIETSYQAFIREIVYTSDSMAEIAIIYDPTVIVSQLNSNKIYDFLSSVGGIWQFFILIFSILVEPVSKLSMNFHITNSLFLFDFDVNPQSSTLQSSTNQQPTTPFCSPSKRDSIQKNKIETIKSNIKRAMSLKNFNLKSIREKRTNSESLRTAVKRYFKETEKHNHLTYTKYIKSKLLCIKSYRCARLKIDVANEKVKKHIDITYIIKKLTEIDKLKMILLTKQQLKLFDYLPKPMIHARSETEDEYWSLLKRDKNDLQQTIDAARAYKQILQQDKCKINQRLTSMLGKTVKELFEMEDDEAQSLDQSIIFNPENDIASEDSTAEQNHRPRQLSVTNIHQGVLKRSGFFSGQSQSIKQFDSQLGIKQFDSHLGVGQVSEEGSGVQTIHHSPSRRVKSTNLLNFGKIEQL